MCRCDTAATRGSGPGASSGPPQGQPEGGHERVRLVRLEAGEPVHGELRVGTLDAPQARIRQRAGQASHIARHPPPIDDEVGAGADVPPGQTGEIWLKGPAVTPGYWRKPEETASAFEQGWLRTGDLGNIDKDGYYYLTDRIKHIIISGGENISPKEVEVVINQLEGVVESSVVGIADERWGQKVVAAVVTKTDSNIKTEKIRAHCKQHLRDWKCPKEVVLVRELPKNAMGKVQKEKVKNLFK